MTTLVKKLIKKQIGKQNKAFMRLSKKRKRIAIAEDVLKHLNTKHFSAETGVYFHNEAVIMSAENADLQTVLNSTQEKCSVCALGALFTCDILKTDNFKVKHVDSSNKMRKKLDYFSLAQLELIECAFERSIITNDSGILRNEDTWKTPNKIAKKAMSFGRRYFTDKKRLTEIMKNIIKNDGEFIP